MYDFSRCKSCGETAGTPTYAIPEKGFTVYVCGSCGFHYIDYLDDTEKLAEETKGLSAEEKDKYFRYIETALQSNQQRFENKVALVARAVDLNNARILDIGAGAGLFLHLLRERSAEVYGMEPTWARRAYAKEHYDLDLVPEAFDAPHWWKGPPDTFDVITMWDVIEHVNFPIQTMEAAMSLLAPGGVLMLDTPARNGFYHRAGEATYKLTGGRKAGFLGMLYSNYMFGHKQIFHSNELRRFATDRGHEVVFCDLVHELSRPYAHYLKIALKSERAANTLAPAIGVAVRATQFANKTVVAFRRA